MYMTAGGDRVGIGADRLSEIIDQMDAWASSYEIAKWPQGARAEPAGRLIGLLTGRIPDPSTGKTFGDLFPVSREESAIALAFRLQRFLFGSPPSHTPGPSPPRAMTDPPIEARGLGVLGMAPDNGRLWAAQPIAIRRVWASLSILSGCAALNPGQTGVSPLVQEYATRHPGKPLADSPPLMRFLGLDRYLKWKTYWESSGMDARERRESAQRWQDYAAALGAPGWAELSEMSPAERSRYEAALTPRRKRVIVLTKRSDWSRPGGYTLSDLAAFAGIRTHRQRQRLRDSLLELGLIQRARPRPGVRRGASAQPTYTYVTELNPSRRGLKFFKARREKLEVLEARREAIRIRDAAKHVAASLRRATPRAREVEQAFHSAAPGFVLGSPGSGALPKGLAAFLREGSALLSAVLWEAWIESIPDPDWEKYLAVAENLDETYLVKGARNRLRNMLERLRAERAESTPKERLASQLERLRDIAKAAQAGGGAPTGLGVLGKLGPEREGWSTQSETWDPRPPVRYLVLPVYLDTTPDEATRRGRAVQVEAFGRPLG